jgi:hypothetical protein
VKAPSFSFTTLLNEQLKLLGQPEPDFKLFDWEPEADCPRKVARNEHDPCSARCPDLSKVL